jgi:TctA family transporter
MMVIAVVVDFLFQSEKSLDKRAYAFFAVAFGYSGAIGLVRWMLARRSPE